VLLTALIFIWILSTPTDSHCEPAGLRIYRPGAGLDSASAEI